MSFAGWAAGVGSLRKIDLSSLRSAVRSSAVGWCVVLSSLAWVSATALVSDRLNWDSELAGEATYLMQAKSIAEDFDLAYERRDFDRYVLWRGREPTDLELVSASGGDRITFHRAFAWAAILAPFTKTSSQGGFVVANVILLVGITVALVFSARRRLGWMAPWVVSILVFCSVAWAYVSLATADLFFFSCAAASPLVMAWGARRSAGSVVPWWLAGVIFANVVTAQPPTLILAAGLIFAVDGPGRSRRRLAFVIGLVMMTVLVLVVSWWAGAGIGGTDEHAQGFRFQRSTGFPLVDFAAVEWEGSVSRLRALSWEEQERASWGLDVGLWIWNGVYFLCGRSIGIVPYFAPVILIIAMMSRRSRITYLVVATAGLWLFATFLVRPFDFFGGPGAIGNRLFMPVYGYAAALVLALDTGPVRWRRSIGVSLACVGIAVVTLQGVWQAPRRSPTTSTGGYSYVSSAASRWLPFEASQRRIPVAARIDHRGRMMLLLGEDVWAEQHTDELFARGTRSIEIVVASTVRLANLILEVGPDAPSEVEVHGASLGERTLRADGGIVFQFEPSWPVRHHPMSWSPDDLFLYPLKLRFDTELDEPLAFVLTGERIDS